MAHPKPRTLRTIVGFALGLGMLWLAASLAGGLHEAITALRRTDPIWLVALASVELVRLALLGAELWALAGWTGKVAPFSAFGLGLVVFGLGAVTPAAPAEGLAVAALDLRRRGLSRRRVALILGFAEWFYQRAFLAVAAIDILAVVAIGRLRLDDTWPYVVLALVVSVALVVTGWVIRRADLMERVVVAAGSLRFRRPREPLERRRTEGALWMADASAMIGTRRQRLRLSLPAIGAALADGAVLWLAGRSLGIAVPFDLAVLASAVGTVATWVPLLPNGLGLVEAVVPTLLHRFDVPLDEALAATLLYRAATTLLPLATGLLAFAGLRIARGRAERSGGRSSGTDGNGGKDADGDAAASAGETERGQSIRA